MTTIISPTVENSTEIVPRVEMTKWQIIVDPIVISYGRGAPTQYFTAEFSREPLHTGACHTLREWEQQYCEGWKVPSFVTLEATAKALNLFRRNIPTDESWFDRDRRLMYQDLRTLLRNHLRKETPILLNTTMDRRGDEKYRLEHKDVGMMFDLVPSHAQQKPSHKIVKYVGGTTPTLCVELENFLGMKVRAAEQSQDDDRVCTISGRSDDELLVDLNSMRMPGRVLGVRLTYHGEHHHKMDSVPDLTSAEIERIAED